MDQPRSEKAYKLKVRRLEKLPLPTTLSRSLKFNVNFYAMRIYDGFCNQAVFAHGLAEVQLGFFLNYVTDNLQTALFP